MSKAIKRIENYQKHFKLSETQTLYLLFKYNDITYPITAKNLLDLMDKNILDEEGNFVENLETVTKLTSKKINITGPTFSSKLTGDIYGHLIKTTCFVNPVDDSPIVINPENIKYKQLEKLTEYKADTIRKLRKEEGFHNAYMLFLSMFPTSIKEDNSRWVSRFKVTYSGVNLRKRVGGNITPFLRLMKKKDTGILMYAVFLYIRSGIKGDQTYIGSQKTFLEEVDDWYMVAETAIRKVTKVEDLFKRHSGSRHKGGVAI